MKHKLLLSLSLTLLLLSGCTKNNNEKIANVISNQLATLPEGTKYTIYDINKDGNVEIFTAIHDSHADGVTIYTLNSKTYKITELGTFGSNGAILIYPKTGYILSDYLGQGIYEAEIYEIVDDNLNTVVTLWTNDGTLDEKYEYKINDLSVSYEEYINTYDKYTESDSIEMGYGNFIEIGDYDTNYNNITAILKK